MEGKFFGSDYLLGSRIGSGAMGTVYRAESRSTGEIYAIKILRPEHSSDRKRLTRFINEREALARVNHSNVVAIEDLIMEGDHFGIVMEFVDGGDLRDLLQEKPMTEYQIVIFAEGLAAGLEAVHSAHIVHRDLKPENILVIEQDDSFLPKVADFGIARLLDDSLTGTSGVSGTLRYMSPEVSDERFGEVGPSADMYSLGVILFELLTGEPPYTHTSPMQLLLAHAYDDIPHVTGIDSGLNSLIRSMLSKEMDSRPTVAELRYQLAEIRAHIESQTSSESADAEIQSDHDGSDATEIDVTQQGMVLVVGPKSDQSDQVDKGEAEKEELKLASVPLAEGPASNEFEVRSNGIDLNDNASLASRTVGLGQRQPSQFGSESSADPLGDHDKSVDPGRGASEPQGLVDATSNATIDDLSPMSGLPGQHLVSSSPVGGTSVATVSTNLGGSRHDFPGAATSRLGDVRPEPNESSIRADLGEPEHNGSAVGGTESSVPAEAGNDDKGPSEDLRRSVVDPGPGSGNGSRPDGRSEANSSTIQNDGLAESSPSLEPEEKTRSSKWLFVALIAGAIVLIALFATLMFQLRSSTGDDIETVTTSTVESSLQGSESDSANVRLSDRSEDSSIGATANNRPDQPASNQQTSTSESDRSELESDADSESLEPQASESVEAIEPNLEVAAPEDVDEIATSTATTTTASPSDDDAVTVESTTVAIGAPSQVRSLVGEPGDKTINWTWSAPNSDGGSDISYYRVELSTGDQVTVNSPEFEMTELKNGTEYGINVQACNVERCGPKSSLVMATPAAPPAPAENLEAEVQGVEVSLTWTAPAYDGGSAIQNYEIADNFGNTKRSIATNYLWSAPQSWPATFRVRACNSAGCGGWSNSKEVSNEPPPAPARPFNFRVVAADSAADLSWTAGPATSSEKVTYQIEGPGGAIRRTSKTSYRWDTLTNGFQYPFRIRGCINGLCSGWTQFKLVQLDAEQP